MEGYAQSQICVKVRCSSSELLLYVMRVSLKEITTVTNKTFIIRT